MGGTPLLNYDPIRNITDISAERKDPAGSVSKRPTG